MGAQCKQDYACSTHKAHLRCHDVGNLMSYSEGQPTPVMSREDHARGQREDKKLL